MTRRFIDTHCHFDFPPFTGTEAESLAQAASAGVEHIIVPAVEAARFATVLELAARFPALWAAIGLHPIVIGNHNDASLALLEHHLQQQVDKLVAIARSVLISIWKTRCLSARKRYSTPSCGLRNAMICR